MADFGEAKTAGTYSRSALDDSSAQTPKLNIVELTTHLEIQYCLDDSSPVGDITVAASKWFLFHKRPLQ